MVRNFSILKIALSSVGWGSAALAGLSAQAFASTPDSATGASSRPIPPTEPLTFVQPNQQNQDQRFAAHSSHASHASHYSGSGGSVSRAPTTDSGSNLDSTTPAQGTPRAAVRPTLPNTAQVAAPLVIVLRVQAELREKGYYNGLIDGQLSETTKDAVKRFQLVKGLPATGALDDATLASLGVNY